MRRGVTLIEAVLFISIALGLIVGGIIFFQQAALSSRVNTQTRILGSLFAEASGLMKAANAAEWDGGNFNYDRLPEVLIAAGAVPANKIGPPQQFYYPGRAVYETSLVTEWGTALGGVFGSAGLLSAGAMPGWEGSDKALVGFVLTDLPIEACTRLATTDESGTYRFGVKTWATYFQRPGNSWYETVYGPVSPQRAAEVCRLVGDFDGAVTLHVHAFLDTG